MATIKAIDGSSIHHIQSGQVIVDLCSVVKELVENSLDARATSIEIRFKNYGLDSIEVQDNGEGIAPEDYETIALKHYTSKLSTYSDLTSLTTFGFRGEALSSLCALSEFHITTARASDGAKGKRLDFETSGKVKEKVVVASQKGTTVAVEDIFRNLPVRRIGLEKNIKREYGKALGLLNAYACISVGVRFSISNQPAKGKKMIVFSTKANPTTRENIANVYGAKTLLALLTLDLTLEMQPLTASTQNARNWSTQDESGSQNVSLQGHISRPVVGEGRQTPDRQMFFVNSRPCALPQVSKAINEVYKSYNVTQSPFIFADLKMDTNAYDVNVSPDKRTILLHDQTALLNALKTSLIELFESHDQSVPRAPITHEQKLPSYRSLTLNREANGTGRIQSLAQAVEDVTEAASDSGSTESESSEAVATPGNMIRQYVEKQTKSRSEVGKTTLAAEAAKKRCGLSKATESDEHDDHDDISADSSAAVIVGHALRKPVQDFNTRLGVHHSGPRKLSDTLGEDVASDEETAQPVFITGHDLLQVNRTQANCEAERIPSMIATPQRHTPGVVQNAFDRMRAKRTPQDVATVTIGNQTTIMTLGSSEGKRRRIHTPKLDLNGKMLSQANPLFSNSLRAFAARGTQLEEEPSQHDADDDLSLFVPSKSRARSRHRSMMSSVTVASRDDDMLDSENEDHGVNAPAANLASDGPSDEDTDGEYLDDEGKKAREEATVARLIAQAEETAAKPTSNNTKRATTLLSGRIRKDSTVQLVQHLKTSVSRIEKSLSSFTTLLQQYSEKNARTQFRPDEASEATAEERLSLTVSKNDFAHMRIIGQFNLGFILAVRPASYLEDQDRSGQPSDELFIIDQHASDEKYNFERLQSETIVQNQRLVHPRVLDLTAIEEEIILNHATALTKNGFIIETDTSGTAPVGRRCQLTSLPMSKEVVFNSRDLEELLALLSEDTESDPSGDKYIPRPTKVRKMFAMRACRSSIMIGKHLSKKQMERVVAHMGEIDKPWNCPHGRPTMRHLFGVDGWQGWEEGDGLTGLETEKGGKTDWARYLEKAGQNGVRPTARKGEEDAQDALLMRRVL